MRNSCDIFCCAVGIIEWGNDNRGSKTAADSAVRFLQRRSKREMRKKKKAEKVERGGKWDAHKNQQVK